MKKLSYYFFLILTICLLTTQCGNKNTEDSDAEQVVPMWIFNTTSNTQQIKTKLEEDRIIDTEKTVKFGDKDITIFGCGEYVVDYLGIDWTGYFVGTVNDTIAIVNLMRIGGHGEDLSSIKVSSLIDQLDKLYGKHRQKNVEGYGPFDDNSRNWDWVRQDVEVRLWVSDAVSKNDVMGLEIINGDKEELENLIKDFPL
ncbi:MAG: hypothetical protein K2K45_06935 [Muribaculaceae bacterium]|nr:hypothetical protein [Muribaculaceae bacterium]